MKDIGNILNMKIYTVIHICIIIITEFMDLSDEHLQISLFSEDGSGLDSTVDLVSR